MKVIFLRFSFPNLCLSIEGKQEQSRHAGFAAYSFITRGLSRRPSGLGSKASTFTERSRPVCRRRGRRSERPRPTARGTPGERKRPRGRADAEQFPDVGKTKLTYDEGYNNNFHSLYIFLLSMRECVFFPSICICIDLYLFLYCSSISFPRPCCLNFDCLLPVLSPQPLIPDSSPRVPGPRNLPLQRRSYSSSLELPLP